MSTTPRTDAAIEKGYACPAAHSPLADTSRQLETELIALTKERDQLLATVEGLKEVIQANHSCQSGETAYDGSILEEQNLKALQSFPQTNLVNRSALERCVVILHSLYHGGPIGASDCEGALKEANAELERTK